MFNNFDRSLQRIERHNGIFKDRLHDAYKSHAKLPEPTLCPTCEAVYLNGRWQWAKTPAGAHKALCPACHRIKDHYPSGLIKISGSFLAKHMDEVSQLIRNHEKHESAEHPLQRIMDMQKVDNSLLISTTDIHLARDIGEALYQAYKGILEYNYNQDENLLRVDWARDI